MPPINRVLTDKTPSVWRVLSRPLLAQRAVELEPEWMDEQGANPEHLHKSLRYLRRINVLLGYTRATIQQLEQYSHSWQPGQTIRILDVATGSGDVPIAILGWAKLRRFNVVVTGIDLHGQTARSAYEAGVGIVQGDARYLPFADGAFDYVISALFLHHLPTPVAEAVLREMSRVAARGIIVCDLLRHRRAYFWITLLSAFANPMVRHDARLSVLQGYSKREVLALRDAAKLQFASYLRKPGHRFMLAGEKVPRPAQ